MSGFDELANAHNQRSPRPAQPSAPDPEIALAQSALDEICAEAVTYLKERDIPPDGRQVCTGVRKVEQNSGYGRSGDRTWLEAELGSIVGWILDSDRYLLTTLGRLRSIGGWSGRQFSFGAIPGVNPENEARRLQLASEASPLKLVHLGEEDETGRSLRSGFYWTGDSLRYRIIDDFDGYVEFDCEARQFLAEKVGAKVVLPD